MNKKTKIIGIIVIVIITFIYVIKVNIYDVEWYPYPHNKEHVEIEKFFLPDNLFNNKKFYLGYQFPDFNDFEVSNYYSKKEKYYDSLYSCEYFDNCVMDIDKELFLIEFVFSKEICDSSAIPDKALKNFRIVYNKLKQKYGNHNISYKTRGSDTNDITFVFNWENEETKIHLSFDTHVYYKSIEINKPVIITSNLFLRIYIKANDFEALNRNKLDLDINVKDKLFLFGSVPNIVK